MAAIPTAEEEDAKRPNRERGNLVTDQTRIVNQIKAILARFGIRTFRPTLRKAAEKLDGLRTAEGTPLLENTRAELRRHLARLRVVREQIRAIEHERLRKFAAAPAGVKGPHAMVRLIAESSALASRRPTCWSTRSSRVTCAIARPSPATLALPARRTRAADAGASGVLRVPATLASGAA
jgi:transposase